MKNISSFTALLILIILCSCQTLQNNAECNQAPNSVYEYLKNAELQYETEGQKHTIQQVLKDMMVLTPSELKNPNYGLGRA